MASSKSISQVGKGRVLKSQPRKSGVNGSYLKLYPNSSYDPTEFERPCITADIAICRVVDGQLQVLLVKRDDEPFKNKWAIPGGFVSIADMEDIEVTAKRKLREETGLDEIPIYQLKAYGESNRDPRWRIVTITYYALISPECNDSKPLNNTNADWHPVNDLPEMAFDHNTIISDLVADLQRRIVIEPIGFSLVNQKFTWTQIQTVYESVLMKSLISPNFRRKVLSDYEIITTDEKSYEGKGRPSALLTFDCIKAIF